jgi:hypothetical protein
MSANIVHLAERQFGKAQGLKPFKIARCLNGPRLLYVGMKVPGESGDTVELRIVSDEAGKPRRNLSRVTLYVDDLRRLVRDVDAEPHFVPQASPTQPAD